jgi:hypothetical protein
VIILNLVSPKVGAKHELLFKKPASEVAFEHLNLTKAVQQSVTQILSVTMLNLVTPKVEAKPEHLFKKPASEVAFEHLSPT